MEYKYLKEQKLIILLGDIMLNTLHTQELSQVSGGNFFDFFTDNNNDCMGGGRSQAVKCYNENGIATRGWETKNWDCAVWFCCSGDKGEYFHVVSGREYMHCKTGARRTISTSNPETLDGII